MYVAIQPFAPWNHPLHNIECGERQGGLENWKSPRTLLKTNIFLLIKLLTGL